MPEDFNWIRRGCEVANSSLSGCSGTLRYPFFKLMKTQAEHWIQLYFLQKKVQKENGNRGVVNSIRRCTDLKSKNDFFRFFTIFGIFEDFLTIFGIILRFSWFFVIFWIFFKFFKLIRVKNEVNTKSFY